MPMIRRRWFTLSEKTPPNRLNNVPGIAWARPPQESVVQFTRSIGALSVAKVSAGHHGQVETYVLTMRPSRVKVFG